MKANRPVNRRRFLQATGTVVALPALESLGYRPFASATPAVARPRRAVFLGFGWGVTEETWLPGPQVTGPGYTLPPGLAPLARHKADFTVVQGLTNRFANEAHWGSTFWLTGANRYAEPGQSFHNSISVDQVVAERLGTSSRFASIQLSSPDVMGNGYGPGLSLAWDARGKSLAGMEHPLFAYHRLFSDETVPLAQRQAMLAQRRSVLPRGSYCVISQFDGSFYNLATLVSVSAALPAAGRLLRSHDSSVTGHFRSALGSAHGRRADTGVVRWGRRGLCRG